MASVRGATGGIYYIDGPGVAYFHFALFLKKIFSQKPFKNLFFSHLHKGKVKMSNIAGGYGQLAKLNLF